VRVPGLIPSTSQKFNDVGIVDLEKHMYLSKERNTSYALSDPTQIYILLKYVRYIYIYVHIQIYMCVC
jgi:hypothetical protein